MFKVSVETAFKEQTLIENPLSKFDRIYFARDSRKYTRPWRAWGARLGVVPNLRLVCGRLYVIEQCLGGSSRVFQVSGFGEFGVSGRLIFVILCLVL